MGNILVADRDLSFAQFIKRILVRRHIRKLNEIIVMCDGLQVREELLVRKYDLTIIGTDLGGVGGLGCIRYMIERNIRRNYLLMIHNANIEVVREACLLGVQGVYETPILIDSFTAIVDRILKNKNCDLGAEIYDLYTKRRFYGQYGI